MNQHMARKVARVRMAIFTFLSQNFGLEIQVNILDY